MDTQAPLIEMEQDTQAPSMDTPTLNFTKTSTLEPIVSQTYVKNQMNS